MNEYQSAWSLLNQVINNGKNLNDSLLNFQQHPKLATIKNISYNVLRAYPSLEFIIHYLVKKYDNSKKIWLLIGLAELRTSFKPEYAVINDLVNAVNDFYQQQSIANFINGVLRNYLRLATELNDKIEKNWSLKYNFPEWWLTKLKQQYKSNYLEFLVGFNHHPAFGLRINPRLTTVSDYSKQLSELDIDHSRQGNSLVVAKACPVAHLPGFNAGLVSVQDVAAQYMLTLLDKYHIIPKVSLDCCAAPGGKTCQLLENYAVTHTAMDISHERLVRIQENLQRLQLSAQLKVGDARDRLWWDGQKFDFIIADVPCSATGTIKRNPDIKLSRRPSDIANFVTIQRQIIVNIWDLLQTGGYLLYITCSWWREENEEQLHYFQEQLSGFALVEQIQLLPTPQQDSLYYALIKKV